MTSKKPLNIFFAVDKLYLIHFTVALTSILENNRDLDINVYVLHDLDDTTGLDEIVSFCKKNYNTTLHLLTVDISIFDNFQITLYISKASYFRLLFADIIPAHVDSGLYIDCDTVVTGSLKELTELSFFDTGKTIEYSILGVSDKNEAEELIRLNNLGIPSKMYFNAGVLFINLEKWREDAVSGKLIQIAKEYKEHLDWWDQDVLNIFFPNQCGKINTTYNNFPDKKLPETPVVIHFTGSSKPWHYFNEHPYKAMYWKYLKLSPFKDQQFEKITLNKVIIKYKGRIKKLLGMK